MDHLKALGSGQEMIMEKTTGEPKIEEGMPLMGTLRESITTQGRNSLDPEDISDQCCMCHSIDGSLLTDGPKLEKLILYGARRETEFRNLLPRLACESNPMIVSNTLKENTVFYTYVQLYERRVFRMIPEDDDAKMAIQRDDSVADEVHAAKMYILGKYNEQGV
jgi:hypothetical protein